MKFRNKYLTLLFILFSLIPSCSWNTDNTRLIEDTITDQIRLELEVYELINQYRAMKNLSPLNMNKTITMYARIHSIEMANKQIPFGHYGFKNRAKSISRSLGLRAVAENVGYYLGCDNCAERAVEEWINSTEHRKTIEGKYSLTGVGVAGDPKTGYYFTQIFANIL